MKKVLILLSAILGAASFSGAYAQISNNERVDRNSPAYRAMMSIQDTALIYPEALLEQEEEPAYTWLERELLHADPDCISDSEVADVPDSIYIMRLRALPTRIEMPFNQPVKASLDLYVHRRRPLVERMVGVGYNHYFPIFEDALQRHGLPSELKYLACIESALRPNAYSRAHAAGLWQFIPSSGILQGLEINSYIDERYDIYKSTDAACRFLKALYQKFNDWHLAIAAYNCGPGNVDKAIARSGGRRTFWEIYNFLPAETRSYVPFFIAATYIMTYHCEHNLCAMVSEVPPQCDTIMLNRMVHFKQIAHYLNTPVEQIESLNPQYIYNIVPGSPEKNYSLMLPADKVLSFIQNQDSIFAYQAETLLPANGNVLQIAQTGTRNGYLKGGGSGAAAKPASGGGVVRHTVRKGENLGSIANRYNTTVAKLKKLNGIQGTTIRAGQKLRVK